MKHNSLYRSFGKLERESVAHYVHRFEKYHCLISTWIRGLVVKLDTNRSVGVACRSVGVYHAQALREEEVQNRGISDLVMGKNEIWKYF